MHRALPADACTSLIRKADEEVPPRNRESQRKLWPERGVGGGDFLGTSTVTLCVVLESFSCFLRLSPSPNGRWAYVRGALGIFHRGQFNDVAAAASACADFGVSALDLSADRALKVWGAVSVQVLWTTAESCRCTWAVCS